MKKNGDLHNLFEYSFAKRVVKDYPQLIEKLDKCAGILYNDMEYRDIANVLYAIHDAKLMLQLHYSSYKEVADKKGKIERRE